MKDLRACWVFTVGILYLLPEGLCVRNGRVRSGWDQIIKIKSFDSCKSI